MENYKLRTAIHNFHLLKAFRTTQTVLYIARPTFNLQSPNKLSKRQNVKTSKRQNVKTSKCRQCDNDDNDDID